MQHEASRLQRVPTPVLVLGTLWALLAIYAIGWGVVHESNDLTARASSALADHSVSAAVSFDGRDALVVAIDDATGSQAAGIVSAVRGVRSVETRLLDPASPTSDAAPVTAIPETTTTMSSEPAQARLVASLADGHLAVTGVFPDPEVMQAVGAVADLVYSPLLTTDLAVDDSLPASSWLAAAPRAIALLPIIGEGTLVIEGTEATLTGRAATELKAATVESALRGLMPDISIDNRIVVTGKDKPVLNVVVDGQGILTLDGVMPDHGVIDLIVKAATDAYGEENVVDNFTVGDNIDRTFSLFRVGFTFAALHPFEEWTITIDDDIITGQLRGGATFATSSSTLTPALEGLLQIAAGILTRNPSLGLVVEGHTDSLGSEAENLRLSQDRAQSAVDFLVAAGIEPARLVADGRGESEPVASNETSAGREMNRRIEFQLAPAQAIGDQ